MNLDNWLRENTFHHTEFSDLTELVRMKEEQGLKISLVIPVLNEEATIGKIVSVIRNELMERQPLVDELAVIDSGSEDRSRELAALYGAKVYIAEEILPELGCSTGKGENLWKALYVLEGDIIACMDGDIRNIHPKFVYGVIGPLICNEKIGYVKAFYERPLVDSNRIAPLEGGRITQILIKPLLNMFFPELSSIIQPLSGEYAGRREMLENIPFSIGYGVEIGLLIDVFALYGLPIIAQVDLDCRIHHNQDLEALERMSYGILQTFFERSKKFGKIKMDINLSSQYWQTIKRGNELIFKKFEIQEFSRPPMSTVKSYRERFKKLEDIKK